MLQRNRLLLLLDPHLQLEHLLPGLLIVFLRLRNPDVQRGEGGLELDGGGGGDGGWEIGGQVLELLALLAAGVESFGCCRQVGGGGGEGELGVLEGEGRGLGLAGGDEGTGVDGGGLPVPGGGLDGGEGCLG